jgi:hypothetical protein
MRTFSFYYFFLSSIFFSVGINGENVKGNMDFTIIINKIIGNSCVRNSLTNR